jgi:hypothetical protein
MKIASKGKILTFVAVVTVLVSFFLVAKIVNADAWSWTGDKPVIESNDEVSNDTNWRDGCQVMFKSTRISIPIQGAENRLPTTSECVLGGTQSYKVITTLNDGYRGVAIQFAGDLAAHQIRGVMCQSGYPACVYLPSTDTLVTVESSNIYGIGRVVIHKNFVKRLQSRNTLSLNERYYDFDASHPDALISDFYTPEKPTGFIHTLQKSTNDKWLVVEYYQSGFFRVDMDTMQMTKFSDWRTDVGLGATQSIEYDISNDGQRIAIFGHDTVNSIYEIVPGCGNTMPASALSVDVARNQDVPCPQLGIGGVTSEVSPSNYRDIVQPQFSDDGGEISYYMTFNDVNPRRVTLRAAGYPKQPPLDYLALGDSYSSGEGDLGKKPDGTDYYTPVSDYVGGCHLSERSYPFQLNAHYGFSPGKMQSVACSGAQTKDIIGKDQYFGQGDRLKNLSGSERESRQSRAIDVFNPGYVHQLEFVKRYQPKSVTLTIGGNDLDFAGIITECAHSLTTCSYANASQLRGQLGQSIYDVFGRISTVIDNLQTASPKTKVYILGYPQFISNGIAICGLNAGFIDSNERLLINEGVTYMNEVIRAATKLKGVVYVDIENSLNGGRLCESASYVSGTLDAWFDSNMLLQTFHPNDRGHQKIAEAVESQFSNDNLLNYSYLQQKDDSIKAPDPTLYFANAVSNYNKSARRVNVVSETVTKGQTDEIKGEKYGLKAGSTAVKKIYSDPVDLGTFIVNDDGSFDTTIVIPQDIPAGFHTLVISGETYSGDPIDLYQIILIQGSNSNDRDEDGILDNQDKCLFMPATNVDTDGDGIDDACDPEIGPPPAPKDPYRIRAGVPTNGENANYLYIERNVNTTTLTGVSGDIDTDNDGWVVIGASQNASQVGPYARFWIDTNKVPHVSLRTAENGCVQYKPANLTKVIDNTARTFTQEAVDTNTCRAEEASVDTDSDGLADNSEPLYRARSGIALKGENPWRLYLERNTHAAEAQLGKSDYTMLSSVPTSAVDNIDHRNTWTLLASTQNILPTVGVFKSLKYIGNQPYVLASYGILNQCVAYKPNSTATIKKSTQNTRALQIDLMQTLTLVLSRGCNG